jgi:hypothetical protein
MRLGPLRLTRHRAMRALAGLVAAFVLTGNVLAAAGLCAIKAPGASHAAVAEEAPDAPVAASDCSQHHANPAAPASSAHHCPTDDPSAQTRAVDLPGAQLMAAFAAVVLQWPDAARQTAALLSDDAPSEPRPLYARLQRLRL